MKHLSPAVSARQRDKCCYKMIALDLDKTLLNGQYEVSKTSIDYLSYLHNRGIIICIATGRSVLSSLKIIHQLGLEYPLTYKGSSKKGRDDKNNSNKNIKSDVDKGGNDDKNNGQKFRSLKGFPLICNNGALGLFIESDRNVHAHVHTHVKNDDLSKKESATTETLLFHHPVPMDVTVRVIELGKSIGCVTNYYIGNHIYTQPTFDWHYKAIQRDSDINGVQYTFCNEINCGDYTEAMERGLPSKLIIMCEKDNVDKLYSQISNELNCSTTYAPKHKKKEPQEQQQAKVMKGSSHVEILQKGICKGTALQKMCHILGVDVKECISFGDAHNDIELIEVSGLGIAMKNGADYLKSIADDITEYSNNEDGVIRAMQKFEQAGMLAFTK